MAKNFDDGDGVWRTIGGRRIFIRTGQSLSDAMKESGKFSRVAKNKELYEKTEKESKTIEENKPAGQKTADLIKESGIKTFADEIKEKEINTKGKTSSEENIKTGEGKSGEVDLVKVNDNIYIPKRSGETEEDAFKKFEKRQQEYRKNLQPEVMKNLRDPRRLWDQDLIDTYIEMNEAGLIQTGEPNKFTRDMKTMTGEPLYSPDREKKTSSEEKTTSQIMNNRLQLKAYQKYLKEHPNSKMTFEDFKKEK